MDIQNIAEQTLDKSQKTGAEKSLVQVTLTEAKEFNIEANKLTLLRTTFDQGVEVRMLLDKRMSSTQGNQFDDDSVNSYVRSAYSSTQTSPQDEANGFAPVQGKKHFSFGQEPVNEGWMHEKLSELLDERAEKFPKLVIEGGILKFIRSQKVLCTSEGTMLSSDQGYYDAMVMFVGKDGKKTSSFNYTTFTIAADRGGTGMKLLNECRLSELFHGSIEQTETKKIPQKFEGDVIVTPHCMSEILGAWIMYLSPGALIKKSSFFLGKLDQAVASPKWTLTSNPADSQFATRKFWNQDGYITQNEAIFDQGVLKRYLLNHYGAIKLGQKVSLSGGSHLKLRTGDTKLQDMIGSVKKGILLGRFSAGKPAENGDISGVAKNSYYIENGVIQYPISETMISMNLAKMLFDIESVSQESISGGTWEYPWVKFNGVTAS